MRRTEERILICIYKLNLQNHTKSNGFYLKMKSEGKMNKVVILS